MGPCAQTACKAHVDPLAPELQVTRVQPATVDWTASSAQDGIKSYSYSCRFRCSLCAVRSYTPYTKCCWTHTQSLWPLPLLLPSSCHVGKAIPLFNGQKQRVSTWNLVWQCNQSHYQCNQQCEHLSLTCSHRSRVYLATACSSKTAFFLQSSENQPPN